MKQLLLYGMLFLLTADIAAQTSRADSAAELVVLLPEDTAAASALGNLCRRMSHEGELAEVITIADKSIAQAKGKKLNKAFLSFLQRVVNVYIDHGQYPKAMDLCFAIKRMSEEAGIHDVRADALNSIGIIYWYEGEYKKALPFFEEVLKIHQAAGNDKAAGVLNNLGLVYRQMGEYDKAIDHYKRAIFYSHKAGRENAEANAYNNLGIIYQLKKEYAAALKYFNFSLDIRKKINDEIGIATSYGNIGTVYFETKKLKEAESYYRESFLISQRIDDVEGLKETGKNLSDLYEILLKPDSALKYYKIHITSRDSLINEATKREALKKEMEYKFEKEQERKTILAEAEKRKQKIFTASVIAILVLISVFALVLMQRFRVTKKQKKIIEEKNGEILASIHYAKRIQQSLLTSQRYIQKSLERLRASNQAPR